MGSKLKVVFLMAAFALLFVGRSAVASNIVINGGFETGNLTGWALGGNTSFTGVGSSNFPHSGNFSMDFGSTGADSLLSQTLPTTPGGSYTLDYWLALDSRSSPNDFSAKWNGGTIAGSSIVNNNNGFGYTEFTFAGLIATGNSTTLEFDSNNHPAWYHLDDVSVTSAPEPGTLLLLGMGVLGFGAKLRRKK